MASLPRQEGPAGARVNRPRHLVDARRAAEGGAAVLMYCEVQLLLEDYRKVRDAMHLFYNVKRCATTGALWRQMAGRVQPKDFAYKSG